MTADRRRQPLLRPDRSPRPFRHRSAHPPHRYQRHRQHHRRRTRHFALARWPAARKPPINPGSLAADTHGNVAFTDTLQSTIATNVGVVREVTAQSTLINLAGAAPKPAPDGTPARDAWLLNPTSITFNRAGDLFIAEFGSCLIRKIGANGLLATAAGTGKCGTSLPATPNTTQDLTPPAAIVVDPQGGFYVLDTLRQFLPHRGRWQARARRLPTHPRFRQDSPSMAKAACCS